MQQQMLRQKMIMRMMMSMTNQVLSSQAWWIAPIDTALHSKIGILFSSTTLHNLPCFQFFIHVLSSLRYSIHGSFASSSPNCLAREVKSATTLFHPDLSCLLEDAQWRIKAKTKNVGTILDIIRFMVPSNIKITRGWPWHHYSRFLAWVKII